MIGLAAARKIRLLLVSRRSKNRLPKTFKESILHRVIKIYTISDKNNPIILMTTISTYTLHAFLK